jgi:cytochrome c
MMGAAQPADLKQAPAQAQVASLQHCRDTYVVKTSDGATHRVWEYNVRLKTDASRNGPAEGKPVVVGSGMRGDRVSIVFSSPADLGRFIKEACE